MSDDNITGRFQSAQPQAGPIQGIGFSLSLSLSDPLLLRFRPRQCGMWLLGGWGSTWGTWRGTWRGSSRELGSELGSELGGNL